jgi:hypothetical protein
MFVKEMKNLIIYAVSKNISDIETKIGYNGAPILKLCSYDPEVVKDLQKWCKNTGFNSKILNNINSNIPEVVREPSKYCLFCVFGKDKIINDYYELL